MSFDLPGIFGSYFGIITVVYLVAVLIVRIAFAAAVGRDAGHLRLEDTGPLIVGPFIWTLATLLGGVFVAGLYWVINHSTLSRR